MQLVVQQHRPTSVIRFMDNISQWSKHHKGKLQKQYSSQIGEKEENAFKKFSEVRKEHDWGSIIDKAFTGNDTLEEAFSETSEELNEEKQRKLEESIETLLPLHDQIQKEWKEEFKETLGELKRAVEENGEELTEKIEEVFDLEWQTEEMWILAYFNGTKNAKGGNANSSEDTVILSLPKRWIDGDFTQEQLAHGGHEILHQIQSQNDRKITEEVTHERPEIVGEAVLRSLLPHGVMGQELLGVEEDIRKIAREEKGGKNDRGGGMYEMILEIYPLVGEYHGSDENFWEDLLPRIETKI